MIGVKQIHAEKKLEKRKWITGRRKGGSEFERRKVKELKMKEKKKGKVKSFKNKWV